MEPSRLKRAVRQRQGLQPQQEGQRGAGPADDQITAREQNATKPAPKTITSGASQTAAGRSNSPELKAA